MYDLPRRMPADYRSEAPRLRRLAREATTPAVKKRLHTLAAQFEWFADGVDKAASQ